jgi:hypothetical protein
VTGRRSAIRNETSDSCRMSFSVSLAIAFEDKTLDQRRFAPVGTEKSRFAGFSAQSIGLGSLNGL